MNNTQCIADDFQGDYKDPHFRDLNEIITELIAKKYELDLLKSTTLVPKAGADSKMAVFYFKNETGIEVAIKSQHGKHTILDFIKMFNSLKREYDAKI